MRRSFGGPTSFLESMQRVQPHLDALAAGGRQPVRVTRVRSTSDGWVIVFRSGEGRERAVVVDAGDGALRGVEPALAGAASSRPGIGYETEGPEAQGVVRPAAHPGEAAS
ncbi:MAG TPA: hypothetical protein VIN03_02485 [Roseateles sp.]